MNLTNEKEQLITQLIRETLSSSIVWKVQQPPYSLRSATENFVPLYLQCQYRGRAIGLYELRQKYFTDEDSYFWTETLGICIVQDDEYVVWQIEEYSPSLKELFQMARHQAAGIRNILGL
ncbi:hypothetical protein K8U54_21545 [Pseudomonas fulva]|uniref:hypothetical protein n=1 Tax=Pseudomonas fulva TaxID=47880 RepID=UPI00201D5571|nr:hypothetical protein [Pseudomonas fulva]UQY34263.1 hypothetical protein K8U54_21545 [Pseudomonas fulva]